MARLSAPVVVVLDTNVLLDILSCHDALKQGERSARDQQYRWRRAGEALHLAIHLHETKAVTLSHHQELVRLTTRFAPPEATDSYATEYLRVWLYFTKTHLLRKWTMRVADAHQSEEKGDAVDDALVQLAAARKVPLVTFEGYGPDGHVDTSKRIHWQAALHGVRVMRPGQVFRGHLKHDAVVRFMSAFAQIGPRFHQSGPDYADAQRLLKDVFEYYKYILGETRNLTRVGV